MRLHTPRRRRSTACFPSASPDTTMRLDAKTVSQVSLPSDKSALEDLALKAEKVQLKLSDARVLYSSIKADAPDPASLDRRVAQLDELLSALQQCMTRLKKR